MIIIIAALILTTVILVSLGLSSRGTLKNQLAYTGLVVAMATTLLTFKVYSWKWALIVLVGCWIVGSVGGQILTQRHGRY